MLNTLYIVIKIYRLNLIQFGLSIDVLPRVVAQEWARRNETGLELYKVDHGWQIKQIQNDHES